MDADLQEEPRRLPSVFAASSAADIAMLNRYYTPNIFAWSALGGGGGVQDDVSDLQLRVASRLRAREELLKQQELGTLWRLQREEMQEADHFLSAFDVQQRSRWEGQGPLEERPRPLAPAHAAASRSSSSSATCRPKVAHGAGPLPPRQFE
ncbi:unnamed protein product, partial [Polarella glacialis]